MTPTYWRECSSPPWLDQPDGPPWGIGFHLSVPFGAGAGVALVALKLFDTATDAVWLGPCSPLG